MKNSLIVKDSCLSFLYFFFPYVFYVATNGGLSNFDALLFGFWLFVFFPTLLLSLALYLCYKLKPNYVIYILTFIFLVSFSLRNYKLFFVFNLVFFFFAYKFGRKILPITVIFSVSFLGISAEGFVNVIVKKYENKEKITNPHFLQKIEKYYQSFKKDANFKIHPNIYHIVLDTYPSNQTLKEVQQIDNSDFYKELRKRDFKVYDNAYSNGVTTTETMEIVFDMKLFNLNRDELTFYGKNPAWGTLFAGGYTVFCAYPCYLAPNNPGRFTNKIFSISDINFLKENNFLTNAQLSLIQFYISSYLGEKVSPLINLTKDQIKVAYYFQAKKLMKNIKPILFYIHDLTYPYKKKRLNDLNHLTFQVLDDIIENEPEAVILLHSDHGNRDDERLHQLEPNYKDTPKENFGILQAVKFPKKCERFNQIEMLSPVNYYQYIHSCLRGEEKPRHLEPANSYMRGLTIIDYWENHDDKPLYMFIKDGKILEKPIKIQE